MLLNKSSDEYDLYTKNEREEFIFVIFQMLVLGGILCQYEDNIQHYLDTTKTIYKDLIRYIGKEFFIYYNNHFIYFFIY